MHWMLEAVTALIRWLVQALGKALAEATTRLVLSFLGGTGV